MISNSKCSFETLFSLDTHDLPKLMIEFEHFFHIFLELFSYALCFRLDQIQQRINRPILLDTAHCFVTASALGYDYYDYFKHLTKVFNPSVVHISTTDMSDGGINDKHLPFFKGLLIFKLRSCLVNRPWLLK